MSIKDILLLGGSQGSAGRAYAISVASGFDAHLTLADLVLDLSSPNAREMLSYDILVSVCESRKAILLGELEHVAQEARRTGIDAQADVMTAPLGTARQMLAEYARQFDLTIVEQSGGIPKKNDDLEIEAALFGSGRPLVIVPYIHKAPMRLNTVLVAWDGSAVAARAIGDAMHLLARAQRVLVVTVASSADDRVENSGILIVRHLARHGINAEFKSLRSDVDPANMLLSDAADSGADLLVMGAYGHSRYRELFLGGTTRRILETMTLPVFMSH